MCRFKKQQLKVLLLVVSIFIEKIKEFTHIYLYWKYFIDFEIHVQLAQSTSRIERIIACKLFRNVASILGSEIITQFGVSELLLLAKDPYCQVRKHAILAFGPVSDMLDSEIVENGIYNALIKNTKVLVGNQSKEQSSAWVIRRACAIVIPEVIRNIHSHKIFLNLLKPIGELFRDK